MPAKDILTALINRDFTSANEAFAKTMQEKVYARLMDEKKTLVTEATVTEAEVSCVGCGKGMGWDPKYAGGPNICSKCVDDPEKYKKAVATKNVKESSFVLPYDKADGTKTDDPICPKCGWKNNDTNHTKNGQCRFDKKVVKEDYNGWKNRETWNVALWIGNDEGLYMAAKEHANSDTPYDDFRSELETMGIGNITHKTPDGVSWNDSGLDIDALDDMIKEL